MVGKRGDVGQRGRGGAGKRCGVCVRGAKPCIGRPCVQWQDQEYIEARSQMAICCEYTFPPVPYDAQ